MHPRTPVIVGVGQLRQRPENPLDALEPVAMMAAAARRAVDDAGAPDVGGSRAAVRIVAGAWPYRDPGRIVGQSLGLEAVDSAVSPQGGQAPMNLLARTALDLRHGAFDVAVIAGAEGINSRRRARRAELRIPYTDDSGRPAARRLGEDSDIATPRQTDLGLAPTPPVYAMFETAIRHERGESVGAHAARVAELWAGFNVVARSNPHAWMPQPLDAAAIGSIGPDNRMVASPYPKLLCANWNLDLAAALLLMTVETAERLGIPGERRVYPWVVAHANDPLDIRRRRDFVSSPAVGACGRAVYAHANIEPASVGPVDLYSCYPSAVQIGADELGLDPRSATVTGGLTFAGGPLNNYVTHSVASMVETLRNGIGAVGLVSANGGYLTKHAVGLFSAAPPSRPFEWIDAQPDLAGIAEVPALDRHDGNGTLETYTVTHSRDGATTAFAAVRTLDGGRLLARNDDIELHTELETADRVGATVMVAGERFTLS